MKTDIKLQVTPEQSEAVQKICFANDIQPWGLTDKVVRNLDQAFISISKDKILGKYNYALGDNKFYFWDKDENKEVDADLFIRTNGTCEEFTCEHPGVNNTTGKCITCGEHIDKSDFEPKNIQSSALSSEQLKLFRAGRNFEVPQYLLNNPTKLLKELNSELMKSTKTTSINLKPECQFAKYGFEKPDFECEILKYFEDDNTLVGYYKTKDGTVYAESWHTLTGRADNNSNKYDMQVNLTPIKKP